MLFYNSIQEQIKNFGRIFSRIFCGVGINRGILMGENALFYYNFRGRFESILNSLLSLAKFNIKNSLHAIENVKLVIISKY